MYLTYVKSRLKSDTVNPWKMTSLFIKCENKIRMWRYKTKYKIARIFEVVLKLNFKHRNAMFAAYEVRPYFISVSNFSFGLSLRNHSDMCSPFCKSMN